MKRSATALLCAVAVVALLGAQTVGAVTPVAVPPPAAIRLNAGDAAPLFLLPVLNSAAVIKPATTTPAMMTRFGPERWFGTNAIEQKKLIVVGFFATYCRPCLAELPELARLDEKYRAKGLGIMLVSIDKGDAQRAQALQLANDAKAQFPVTHDRFQVVARRYGAESLPHMVLVDGEGRIKSVRIGYTPESIQSFEGELRSALGLPAEAVAPTTTTTPKK